ncbi:hypothetical protein PHYBOEH_011961 [Phytophthora boehmeriae]|uniref:FYVE zinc finger domain-containing protein n=1 Tax=Phytophthora boehmeriae TaxID=109152 RepID=A0A8T1VGP7_9STRA|nr:hypothetical protein PHYBOEH_011961 [Phytophthora boehmeriae]
MGSSCDECGKKFKVFGLKKKCKHCMDVVCKSCLPAHLELKHTHLGLPPRNLRRRKSHEYFEAAGRQNDQEELQFLSPSGSPDLELEYADPESPDVLEGVDDIENVSDEDDDGDFFELEDGDEDDDLLMPSLGRQTSVEEEEIQYREMQKIQGAVAVWALKEKQAKQRLKRKKKDSYCSMTLPVDCEYETCALFAVSYTVVATVIVWGCFGLLFTAYFRARNVPLAYVF